MSFRDGSLSSFPGGTDSFTEIASGDVIRAAHFNHYFDACLQLERFLFGSAGGALSSRYSSSVSGSKLISKNSLLIGYQRFTAVVTGNTGLIISGTVPAFFGTNPFVNRRFSVAHTAYILNEPEPLRGAYAGGSYDEYGALNDMLTWSQIFVSVAPTGLTGSDFSIHVKFLNLLNGQVDPNIFEDSFDRSSSHTVRTAIKPWVEHENSNDIAIISNGRLRIYNTKFSDPQGAAISIKSTSNDFQFSEAVFRTHKDVSNHLPSGGLVVRYAKTNNASNANATYSFYGLIITLPTSAYLAKFVNKQTQRRFSGNVQATEVLSPAIGIAIGDTLRLAASGDVLKVFRNEVNVFEVTDTTIVSGDHGLIGLSGPNNVGETYLEFDDYKGGTPTANPVKQVRVNLLYLLMGDADKVDTV